MQARWREHDMSPWYVTFTVLRGSEPDRHSSIIKHEAIIVSRPHGIIWLRSGPEPTLPKAVESLRFRAEKLHEKKTELRSSGLLGEADNLYYKPLLGDVSQTAPANVSRPAKVEVSPPARVQTRNDTKVEASKDAEAEAGKDTTTHASAEATADASKDAQADVSVDLASYADRNIWWTVGEVAAVVDLHRRRLFSFVEIAERLWPRTEAGVAAMWESILAEAEPVEREWVEHEDMLLLRWRDEFNMEWDRIAECLLNRGEEDCERRYGELRPQWRYSVDHMN